MKQAFAATNKSVTIAASLCIHDAPLTYRLTDSLSYCRMEMMKHCNCSRSPSNGAMTDRHGHQSVHIFELAGNHRNE